MEYNFTLAADTNHLRARFIPALEGWRGIAILLVLYWHLWPSSDATPRWFASFGWVGVDLFFVLSGFLITRILLASHGQPHYFRNFYARRTLRIFPLYYVTLFAVYIAWPVLNAYPSPDYKVAAVGLAYLTNFWSADTHRWFPAPLPFSGSHLWSLAIEEQFYLAWPIIVRLLNRRALVILCGFLVFTSDAFRLAFWIAGAAPIEAYMLPFSRMDAIAFGAVMAVAATSPRWTEIASRIAAFALPLSTSGIAFVFIRCRSFNVHVHPLVYTLGISLDAPFFASLIWLTLARPAGNFLDRIISFRLFRWFGKYSYGLYIFHGYLFLIFRGTVWQWTSSQFGNGILISAVQFTLSVGLCGLIAFLSYHLFERQIFALKRRFPEAMASDEH